MNNVLETRRKKVVVVVVVVFSKFYPAFASAWILTGHLLNKGQEHYRYTNTFDILHDGGLF
jgi:hypothetical protein